MMATERGNDAGRDVGAMQQDILFGDNQVVLVPVTDCDRPLCRTVVLVLGPSAL